MKRKNTYAISLVFIFVLSFALCVFASAAEAPNETVTYFEDGSYMISKITEDAGMSRASGSKSGTKENSYYNSNDELAFVLRVHGSFTYTGTSAKATSADYSYDIYDSNWSFKSGSASYSSATATAKGTFSHLLLPKTATVSLTCSANGTLS